MRKRQSASLSEKITTGTFELRIERIADRLIHRGCRDGVQEATLVGGLWTRCSWCLRLFPSWPNLKPRRSSLVARILWGLRRYGGSLFGLAFEVVKDQRGTIVALTKKSRHNWSGKRATLPPLPPLRTGRESFPSSGSSRHKAPRERSRHHDGLIPACWQEMPNFLKNARSLK